MTLALRCEICGLRLLPAAFHAYHAPNAAPVTETLLITRAMLVAALASVRYGIEPPEADADTIFAALGGEIED